MKKVSEMKIGDMFWGISGASKPEEYEYYSTEDGEDYKRYYVKDISNPERRFMLAVNIHNEMDETKIKTMGAPFYTTREECKEACLLALGNAIKTTERELEFYKKSLSELESEEQ